MVQLKKILSLFVALFFTVYCGVGLGSSVTDKPEKTYKNVILMIGDGMGENTLNMTEYMMQRPETYENDQSFGNYVIDEAYKAGTLSVMRSMNHANSDTRSFILDYTDSAAGGTALSCGVRVWIDSVAVLPFLPIEPTNTVVPMSLTELAITNGKKAGVVTTDKTSGATPAAFSAHALLRQEEANISRDQLGSDLDLIWGGNTKSITKEKCEKNGFTYVENNAQVMALEKDSRSIAQFNFDDMYACSFGKNSKNDTPRLCDLVEKATSLLDNENGFFLMVEGACIDKSSHNNNAVNCMKNVIEFDKAIGAALDFAEKDGETLVVVTADHETGGITENKDGSGYHYTKTDHSTADVPIFFNETESGLPVGKVIENRQISVQCARAMGFGKNQFPAIKGYSYNPKNG